MLVVAIGLTLAGVVLGAVWLRVNRGHYWQWDAREVGGLCVLAWNAAVLACVRRHSVATMVGGVLGNAVVAAAWFGPFIIEQSAPRALLPSYAPLLAAFVMGQLALALAGLLPAGWLGARGPRDHGTA
jgi:hypothetical protein